jgi:hypothetical protein
MQHLIGFLLSERWHLSLTCDDHTEIFIEVGEKWQTHNVACIYHILGTYVI